MDNNNIQHNDDYNKKLANATDNPFALVKSEEEELVALTALELLTPKQRKFCEEYIKSFNAAKAASDAGYSVVSSASIGYSLLRRPEVQAYIEALREINSHKYRHTILDQLAGLYDTAKEGDIEYQIVKDEDGMMVARPIMRENPDGTITVHRSKPNYKIALDTLKTMAEYTLPKPETSTNDKLAIANKYIQNNTYISNNQQSKIQDHINKVINNQ